VTLSDSLCLLPNGSVVSIDADADLEQTQATATGWAVVPSLRQAHPFTIYPAGHSAVVEKAVKKFKEIKVNKRDEYSTKNGKLRVAEVRMPTATGGTRTLTVSGTASDRRRRPRRAPPLSSPNDFAATPSGETYLAAEWFSPAVSPGPLTPTAPHT
jgi:hypothetical protein